MLNSKQDYRALCDKILSPLKPLYSDGGARLNVGQTGATYAGKVMELEAFSRPLWALVPFWAGGGFDAELEKIYASGLANGTNPQSAEYWGGFTDYDQRFVEMAAIACGLILTPEKTWQPLSKQAKANLASWLYEINNYIIPQCNWQFFMILVNVALRTLGEKYSEKRLNEGLCLVDSYYLGDGWYCDGASCQKDYYISFAMHYYGLMYSKFCEKDDPVRSAQFKNRAEIFAKDFIYWFADDGAALPFGRSLTYRFAQCSFWSACLFAGVLPFSVGVIKGIISRNFQWWLKQDMFDRDGILTIGYAYPNLIMAERYNAPGSPYWAMKSFLLLALPDEHPFWAAKPERLPQLDAVKPLKCADMLMHRSKNDVVAYTPAVCELYGHGHTPEKYSKFAYSTAFGFSVMRSAFVLNEACCDSMLGFIVDDTVFVRKKAESHEIGDNSVYSQWSPCRGIKVTTVITPCENGHIRRHEIESEIECEAVDMGFAVPRLTDKSEGTEIQSTFAKAFCGSLSCTVSTENAKHDILIADPNTSIMFKNTAIPYSRTVIKKGKTVINTIVNQSNA